LERSTISTKCPECGSLLKKDVKPTDEEVICQICETHYKIVTDQNGKICLEPINFNSDDLGEL
jgi:DNA-directed RNA polymerase subunit M/transcription elongation factor TFIIS